MNHYTEAKKKFEKYSDLSVEIKHPEKHLKP